MISFRKWMPISGIIILGLLIFGGCARKGTPKENDIPIIEITSYGGADADTLANVQIFQQKIFWSAYDRDGVVDGYAYRVLDSESKPIPTSGHQYIDDQGWIYHYKPGVDVTETTPTPDTPGYGTIWTDEVYAVINFPANVNGDSANVSSIFEVKAIDNKGDESSTVRKYFTAESKIPRGFIQQKIDHQVIGRGIVIDFSISDTDLGVGNEADHFEFMLKRISRVTGEEIPEEGYGNDNWYQVYKQNRAFKVTISQTTTPRLVANEYNEIYDTFLDSTYLVFKAIDLAGIESEPDTVVFASKEGFHPGTLIYESKCLALGKYHYSSIRGDEVVPSYQNAAGVDFYATQPFFNLSNNKSLIGSNDIKLYMNWGWHGEYESDDVKKKKKNDVKDEDTDANYFGKITYFLVRLDNKPLYIPSLPADDATNIYEDANGVKWLKISSSSYNFQSVILTKTTLQNATGNLFGFHKFEVCAMDIQNVVDTTPAEYVFNIEEYNPSENRSGILMIDDDLNNTFSERIDARYDTLFADYSSQMTKVGYLDLAANPYNTARLSITDLQKYKFVVLHNERINDEEGIEAIQNEFSIIKMYLDFGGNMMISGGGNLRKIFKTMYDATRASIFEDYFGIALPELGDEHIGIDIYKDNTGTQSNIRTLQFFISTTPASSDYNSLDFDINFAKQVYPYIGVPSLNPFGALGGVGYIYHPTLDSTPIYYFHSIEAGDGPHQPTESQYEEFNSSIVAQKKVTDRNKCYIITVPLSYLDVNQAKDFCNTVTQEVLGQ